MMVAARSDFQRKLSLLLGLLPRKDGPLTVFVKTFQSHKSLSDCYAALNIPEDSDEMEVREAFINLSKKYHPDSGSRTANVTKFLQIQDSYKTILAHKQNKKPEESEEDAPESSMKHVAPQHRQYLSYEGVGYGTPSQRHKQYQNYRVERATENVFEHHKQKYTAKYEDRLVKNRAAADQIKKSGGMARLVEDLIQESMKKGEFDNLPGMGKPLKDSYVPYGVDSMTHNINKILINNGYAPEWITLEKEIKQTFQKAKRRLFEARQRLGLWPLDPKERQLWCNSIGEFEQEVVNLNKQIDKFNMITPVLSLQMPHYRPDIPIKQIEGQYSPTEDTVCNELAKQPPDGSADFERKKGQHTTFSLPPPFGE